MNCEATVLIQSIGAISVEVQSSQKQVKSNRLVVPGRSKKYFIICNEEKQDFCIIFYHEEVDTKTEQIN